jgi:tetratricopeptide (TPR) repeat protein
MLMTVASVVFRPEDGALWVASGEAPTSHREFVPFSLETSDHAPSLGVLTGGVPSDERSVAAFDAFRRAYLAHTDADDLGGARAAVDEARALAPEQPLYHLLAGMLALEAGDAGRALAAFEQAVALGHPSPERRATFRLWRGRASDALGDRRAALSDYRAVLAQSDVDPNARAAAAKGLRRAYTIRAARGIRIEFANIDVIRP